MEYSEPADATPEPERPQNQGARTARAILSATIFGSIGALIGRWMGRHGNDPRSNLAEPITQWGMGVFCGTLGAYSSLKASEPTQYRDNPTPANAIAKQEEEATPNTRAQTAAARNDGKVSAPSAHVALEK